MDGERVPLLLPRVCEVLADPGKSLPDDTSLEKLLDWFTELAETGGHLLQSCPCLLGFISAVTGNAAPDPAVLSFALKLAGLAAGAEGGFRALQERSALDRAFDWQRWEKAGLWEDPCVRIGWIEGLRRMLQHPPALAFLVKSDLVAPLLQLQTDASLFVASAANQTLAHVLLFFQPGEDRGSAERNGSPAEAPAAEGSPDYSAAFAAISERLRESLVPAGAPHLQRSLQALRLLALLLGRAGPPLRDRLLRAAAASLDELVTAEHSQLTPAVMDVVMAAYSCGGDEGPPHPSVSRHLSSMLRTSKAANLVHAAAAFLRAGRRDGSHAARAISVLLSPLDVITDQTLLDADPAADELRSLMRRQLRSKTACVSVVCVCLRNAPQVALMPPDVLACPPVSVVLAVLSLLRTCCGDPPAASSNGSGSDGGVSGNVIASGKVQKCALEALTSLSGSPGAEDMLKEVSAVLIQYLDNPDSDPTVLHKSYKALVRWMGVCRDLSPITDQLGGALSRVVRKRACDLRWEVRDSTAEFLGQLAGVRLPPGAADGNPGGPPGACCAAGLLREALQDPESYVRASAVSALAQALSLGWQQGAAPPPEQADVVTRLLEILSEDTEGFARRAVVRFFISWFSSRAPSSPPPPPPSCASSSLLMSSVRTVLSRGSADLDWEVKVHTLELAELLMDEALSGHLGYRRCSDARDGLACAEVYAPSYTPRTHAAGGRADLAEALESLVEQGVVSALLTGLVDCDRPVGLKACRLLMALRETVRAQSPGTPDATATGVSCTLPGRGWGREIERMVAARERGRAKGAKEAPAEGGFGEADDPAECDGGEGAGERGVGTCVGVCDVLGSLGLDERLAVLTQSSDHVHNSLPSLLQDILTAGAAAHARPDAQRGEEVIVDCY